MDRFYSNLLRINKQEEVDIYVESLVYDCDCCLTNKVGGALEVFQAAQQNIDAQKKSMEDEIKMVREEHNQLLICIKVASNRVRAL